MTRQSNLLRRNPRRKQHQTASKEKDRGGNDDTKMDEKEDNVDNADAEENQEEDAVTMEEKEKKKEQGDADEKKQAVKSMTINLQFPVAPNLFLIQIGDERSRQIGR